MIAASAVLVSNCFGLVDEKDIYLDALAKVETGNKDVSGDGGRSIGPLQIQRAYWNDSKVSGKYEDCHGLSYSRAVVLAYARRYEPGALKSGNWRVLARLHNAGPNWRKKKKATDKYVEKVIKEMERLRKS